MNLTQIYSLFLENQNISTDSRAITSGCIFFALKGPSFNGNAYAQKALESGAAYAVIDEVAHKTSENCILVDDVLSTLQQLANHHRRQLGIPVIGIVGSNGKTTTKELIAAVLEKKYHVLATKGNLNNHIGVPLTLLALTSEHEMAIVEMGANHQGEIAMLSDLSNPDYGMITNIGKAHLEGFGGIEGVKKGKSELYKHIKQKNGKIFINGNDSVLMELSNDLDKIYYGENSDFDVHGKLFLNSEFVEFKWNVRGESIDNQPLVKTHMFGQYNFINLLCAACIGNYFGVTANDVNDALASYIPEMNRSQIKKTLSNTLILDAYNANPSSMGLAIDNFNKQVFDNKIVILGDMLELGEYSEEEHKKIIKQIECCDFKRVVFVGIQFFKLKDQFSKFQFFKNIEELHANVDAIKINGSIILIKGSRGIRLEKIVDIL